MRQRDTGQAAVVARRATGPAMALIALAAAVLLLMYAFSTAALAQDTSPSPTDDAAASPAATEMASPDATDAAASPAASPELPDTAIAPNDSGTGGSLSLLIVLLAVGSAAVMLFMLRPARRPIRDDDTTL